MMFLGRTGYYKSAVGLKNRNPDLKVLIAIGGWNEGGKKYSEMAASQTSRQKYGDWLAENLIGA